MGFSWRFGRTDMQRASRDLLAFDRTQRSIDSNGHLIARNCVISESCVSPYRGSEIPLWRELGLISDHIYELWRPPNELKRAAEMFNGKPLLLRHRAVTANDHDPGIVVGTVSNVRFDEPYLRGDLTVWTKKAIDLIESNVQRDLSCAYKYSPVMRSGNYRGHRYDGLMANVEPNHIAMVADGRVESAMVADSKGRWKIGKDAAMARKRMSLDDDARSSKILKWLSSKLSDEDTASLGKILSGEISAEDVEKLLNEHGEPLVKNRAAADVEGAEQAKNLALRNPGGELRSNQRRGVSGALDSAQLADFRKRYNVGHIGVDVYGRQPQPAPAPKANDQSSLASFHERFPGTKHVRGV